MTNIEIKETQNHVEIVPLVPNPEKGRPSQRRWLMPVIFGIVVLAVLFFGIRSRLNAEASLRTVTAQMAVPSVSVAQPKLAAAAQEIILPGNMQPFISSPVYARTDGYLKKWVFDIGAHVKAGQLLATIQSPEIDEQLSQAKSTLATAQANLNLAEITKTRYEAMFQKHAVAQQDRDNAEGTYSANKATVDADMANMRHYEALVSFEKVYAPFDGVITARNTDIGDLINSGSSSTAKTDLFHIAQTGAVRVYVKFPGKVVRTAEAINGTTRTLLTEIDLPNPGNTLLTGSYAEVHLRIPSANSTFLIPVSTLIFRSERLQAGVVRNGKVELADLTPGHDFGGEIEVVAGLKAGDQVVMNPPDSLVSGQQVNIVQASLPGDGQ